MKSMMLILGSGGHTSQMILLTELLGSQYKYVYVVANEDSLSERKIKIAGEVCKVIAGVNFTGRDSKILSFFKNIICLLQAFFLVLKKQPDLIIGCGPGIAAIFLFVGKLLGVKTIFLESWSRIYNKSKTGAFAYHFTDLFLVQWPEMLKLYPKAIYAGRLIPDINYKGKPLKRFDIFVTVGSTQWDSLIKHVDKLVGQGEIKGKVIMQIGNGSYVPKNCRWFRFAKSLIPYFKAAKLVITHEGAGTLLELVSLGKPAIALTNPNTINNPDVVKKLSREGYLVWCKSFNKLTKFCIKAKSVKFKDFRIQKRDIKNIINNLQS